MQDFITVISYCQVRKALAPLDTPARLSWMKVQNFQNPEL